MWKAPYRPNAKVSQSFPDGVVRICSVTDTAAAGYQPKPRLTLKSTLRFATRRVGVQRYYAAAQNLQEISGVIRVPANGPDIVSKDVAILGDRQYRIDLVQNVPDVWPRCVDLTLVDINNYYAGPEEEE